MRKLFLPSMSAIAFMMADATGSGAAVATATLQTYDATKPGYIDPAHVPFLAPGTPIVTIDPATEIKPDAAIVAAAPADPANPSALAAKVDAIARHVGLIDLPVELPDGFHILTAQEYATLSQSDQMVYIKNAAIYQTWQAAVKAAAFTADEIAYIRRQFGMGGAA